CLSDFRNLEAPVVEKTRSQERADCERRQRQQDSGWQLVMERPNFRLWRRPIPGSHLYQYRVFGTYMDVTPRQFFNVQYPFYSRDYLYIRRYQVDQKHNLMVLVSRAIEHPDVPESPSYVRVTAYQSQMVIKPHRSFDENGFDYLLTYSDDPQTVFPRYCVSWMVSSGMPDFLEKLHTAAVRARNMEIKVKDYISGRTPESPDSKQLTNTDRQEKNCSSQQMDYA
ncbi:stAR-related lipid transfer protein 7, mitochondrial, partial [Chiloscyllium plagiosum]|uniref:stAR-related lipid transfer protein 7, mitochondrial n=1 Tax=Chiloscyllium plagiosum TaxID=36176 RepID=UPI001CB84464